MNRQSARAKSLFLLSGAAVAISAAFVVIFGVGLPERANYTGQIIAGERPIVPELDAIAPPFEQPTLSGGTVNLFDLRGQPVILNFWATWCSPCEDEMQSLQTLYADGQESGLRVVGVNLGESSEVVATWVQRLKLTFDIVLDQQQRVAALYQLRGTPSTYIIAPDGIISQIYYGPISWNALQEAVTPYVSAGR